MTTKEVLEAAKKRIEDPVNWGQGAKYKYGVVRPGTECAMEAVGRVLEPDIRRSPHTTAGYQQAENALKAAMGESPVYFNDDHTHAEVMEAFDRAIEAL